MRYALIDGRRLEATPKCIGKCPGCGSDMLAKCGNRMIWHWAHKGRRHCDHWWENETEWHRNWKDFFPKEMQEVVSIGNNGETHIADVKLPNGFVLEFQHSPINLNEARKRTEFYGSMLWVVDGNRRKKDCSKFHEYRKVGIAFQGTRGAIYSIRKIAVVIVSDWIDQGVPIAFDFGGESLWLMFARNEGQAFVTEVRKEWLVKNLIENQSIPSIHFLTPVRSEFYLQEILKKIEYLT